MTEPSDSRMSEYVRQKNALHAHSGLHDDLKVFPSPPDGAAQHRSKKDKRTRTGAPLQSAKAMKMPPFYNDDTASLNDTSTSGSVLGMDLAGQESRAQPPPSAFRTTLPSGHAGGEPDQLTRAEPAHHIIDAHRHDSALPAVNHQIGGQRGFDDVDSYPATTSGHPSQPPSPILPTSPGKEQRYSHEPFRMTQRSKSNANGAGMRRSDSTHAEHVGGIAALPPPPLSLQALGQTRPHNVIDDINGGFAFTNPQAGRLMREAQPLPDTQHAQVHPPQMPMHMHQSHAQPYLPSQPPLVQPQPEPAMAPSRHRQRQPQPPPPQRPQPQPLTAEPLRPSAMAEPSPNPPTNHRPTSGSRDRQAAGDGFGPGELDYDAAQLRTLSFSALQEQSFDVDPQGSSLNDLFPAAGHHLPTKLDNISTRPVDEQTRFFASLALDDWERAGDWFLDRFADISRKLQAARRTKRDLARRFEADILLRHDQIAQKRRQTDAALHSMRETGGKILLPAAKRSRSEMS